MLCSYRFTGFVSADGFKALVSTFLFGIFYMVKVKKD